MKYEAWIRVEKEVYLGEFEAETQEEAEEQAYEKVQEDMIDWESKEFTEHYVVEPMVDKDEDERHGDS